ncbi:MAG: dTMP kinase [Phyllobacteriaceae bacterium]|nr:dTMP kinase [Phyllobacteriaceae bacterium]
MKRGFFITLEGGEGSGKSTQAKRLAAHLAASGIEVVLTREPGGTPQGEALRALLVSGDTTNWSAASEAMLMSAAREVHVRTIIEPALARGAIVISDRFMDSTRVYQGYAGGVSADVIAALESAAVGECMPDLTLIFDLPAEQGLARAGSRGTANEDRFERKGRSFHEKLRQGFLAIAAAEPRRCTVIDASAAPDAVFSEALLAVESHSRG